ncbi:MAG: SMP-30/gluconolactonase/LRE family protein [Pseudomonadales bacterium]
MRFIKIGLFLTVAALVTWLLWPGPVNSDSWLPPEAPSMTGVYQANNALKSVSLIAKGEVYGPEDIAVDAEGVIYAGMQDGRISRIVDGKIESWINTGGRPLGLHFDAQGNLIVCDAWKGLLSVNPNGEITVLTTEAEGLPFRFVDDLDIASDGIIYFSDASSRFDQPDYMLDLLEAKPWGRLLSYDPVSRETKVLIRGLYFANGVALSSDESYVLVNETYRYRISRYWLKGDKAGSSDIFIDNLAGFPDGISSNRNGTFWVAMPSPRMADIDDIHTKPWLKDIIAKLPDSVKPAPLSYGLILELNEAGEVVASYHDTDGKHVREITSVQQVNDDLYIGNLHQDWVGKISVEALRASIR